MSYPKTAQFISEKLQGTCLSLTNVLEQYDMEAAEDDLDFCNELDSYVFCCEQCGWWCEQSEMAETEDDDWICDDCA